MLPKDNGHWSGDKQFYVYLFFLAHRVRKNDPENHAISNLYCLNVNKISVVIIIYVIVKNLEDKEYFLTCP